MTRVVVAPIVEGDGEVSSLPILIRRIGQAYCPEIYFDVLKPIRMPASSLLKADDPCLRRAVGIAEKKLTEHCDSSVRKFVLILLDAEGGCAATLGPALKERASEIAAHLRIACVIAVDEYETWFVAAAESLTDYLDVKPGEVPSEPETRGAKKKWIEDRFRGRKYRETVDQPKFSAVMDLNLCRNGPCKAPSFDKLCREIERMATPEDDVAVT